MLHTTNQIIKHKVGLLNLAEELQSVSKACKVMGVSRDTIYLYQESVKSGDVDVLINKSRRIPNLKNRVDEITEQAVIDYAIQFPAYGQHRTRNELRKGGVFVSGSGVSSIWLRHNLENFKKRLKALEVKVTRDGIELNYHQIAALERKHEDDVAYGKIETHHPGYLGSQDPLYVGNLKGVGRIYQQTFIDTYSKVVHCKLYTTKAPVTAVDLLSDRVLPFYESHDLPMLRILTDRGTEYCGKIEQHDYELYLALNDIDPTKTKSASPQTNGICECFHKTILQEFYQIAFRKKLFNTLETLQNDLDEWLRFLILSEPIRAKCAAGVRLWIHYLMENRFGLKKI